MDDYDSRGKIARSGGYCTAQATSLGGQSIPAMVGQVLPICLLMPRYNKGDPSLYAGELALVDRLDGSIIVVYRNDPFYA